MLQLAIIFKVCLHKKKKIESTNINRNRSCKKLVDGDFVGFQKIGQKIGLDQMRLLGQKVKTNTNVLILSGFIQKSPIILGKFLKKS